MNLYANKIILASNRSFVKQDIKLLLDNKGIMIFLREFK